MYLERRSMETKPQRDPSYFYKYQKRFSKKKEEIGDLKIKVNDEEIMITDDKGIAKF